MLLLVRLADQMRGGALVAWERVYNGVDIPEVHAAVEQQCSRRGSVRVLSLSPPIPEKGIDAAGCFCTVVLITRRLICRLLRVGDLTSELAGSGLSEPGDW